MIEEQSQMPGWRIRAGQRDLATLPRLLPAAGDARKLSWTYRRAFGKSALGISITPHYKSPAGELAFQPKRVGMRCGAIGRRSE